MIKYVRFADLCEKGGQSLSNRSNMTQSALGLPTIRRLIVGVTICAFLSLPLLRAQAGKPGGKVVGGTSSNNATPSPVASFEGQLVSIFDPNGDNGDYIPCEFTVAQLLTLNPKPEVSVLSSYDEEQIKYSILSAVLSPSNNKLFDDQQRQHFAKSLSETSLEGLTMSQALAVVIQLLSNAAFPSAAARSAYLDAQAGVLNQWLDKNLAPQHATEVKSKITASTPIDAINQAIKSLQDLSKATVQPPSTSENPGVTAPSPTGVPTDVSSALSNLQLTQKAMTGSSERDALVDSASRTISAFLRPPDVGCAMSILSWNSVRYAFGETLANEYIAVQIVVRNLNPDKEFLVHDAEFSVDSELSGSHGRYYSGLDKLTVRNFMLASRNYGRRNLMVNMAQGVGVILSAVTPIYGTVMKDAASVYNSGFLTAFTGVWKDSNTDQLNLLNDVGFSASKTDRTVVPKSGSVMFVIFVPSRQFEAGWWTQQCANVIVTSVSTASSEPSSTKGDAAKGSSGKDTSSMGAVEPAADYKKLQKYQRPQIGINVDAARNICQQYYTAAGSTTTVPQTTSDDTDADTVDDQPSPGEPGEAATTNGSVTQGRTTISYIKSPRSLPYRDWPDNAYAIFSNLSYAVVAGSHVQEESDTTPGLSKIDCPVDAKGDIDFSKAANNGITCSLTGQNLDKVAKLKLRDSDTQTADATVTTSGDAKSAKAFFSMDQIGPLGQKTYKVFTVTKDGIENGGSQVLHFNLEPLLSADPDAVPLDKLTDAKSTVTVTLKGYHLDKVTKIKLSESESPDDVKIEKDAGKVSGTTASFDLSAADGTQFAGTGKMYIFLISKDQASVDISTGRVLVASGKTPVKPTTADKLILSMPKSVASNSKLSFVVSVKSADGKADTSFTGTMKFSSTDKAAILPSGYTFKSADKGQHKFDITFKTVGKQTVTASASAVSGSASTVVK
jgi:hypothetical protein